MPAFRGEKLQSVLMRNSFLSCQRRSEMITINIRKLIQKTNARMFYLRIS